MGGVKTEWVESRQSGWSQDRMSGVEAEWMRSKQGERS